MCWNDDFYWPWLPDWLVFCLGGYELAKVAELFGVELPIGFDCFGPLGLEQYFVCGAGVFEVTGFGGFG